MKVYCHTSYTHTFFSPIFPIFPNTGGLKQINKYSNKGIFEEGNWYIILDDKALKQSTILQDPSKLIRVIDDNNKMVTFCKKIEDIPNANDEDIKLFNTIFYTEQEYRDEQLNKLLN